MQLITPDHLQARFSLVVSAIISALGFRATVRLIPVVQRMTLRRGMFGACEARISQRSALASTATVSLLRSRSASVLVGGTLTPQYFVSKSPWEAASLAPMLQQPTLRFCNSNYECMRSLLIRHTLRCAGLDINKKGTEAGEKRVPEALGLAPGVVFLV